MNREKVTIKNNISNKVDVPETLTELNMKLKIRNNELVDENLKLQEECESLKAALEKANQERELLKIIQDQVKISEENFRHLSEALPQIVWTSNPDGSADYFNQRGLDYIGASGIENIREVMRSAIHPEDLKPAMELWQKALQRKKVFETNYRLRRYDQKYHWFLVRGIPQLDDNGNVIKWYGTLTNINDQKLLEEKLKQALKELKQAQIRYSNAERLAKLGSWMHNIETDEMIFSNEFYNIYEVNKTDNFYYHEILKMVHPDDVKRLSESIKKSIVEKNSFDIQYRLIMKDGRIKTIHTISEPELDSSGKVIKRYGATMDITESKLQELRLKRTLEELERSNKDLENYAYIASHDLQEPLRIISNFSNLLAQKYKSKLDEGADEYINFILESTKRMRLLITDLLQYARIPSSAKNFVLINMNELVNEVCLDLQILIQDSGATINCDPLPVIITDRVHIKQLFQNLITNAIKFRGDNKPVIHILAIMNEETVTFKIKDNGIGFDLEYSPKIFELFHRLHERDKYSGTGIGLALCKKIVEQHGGVIGAESEPGKGSTFYFTLPIIKQ